MARRVPGDFARFLEEFDADVLLRAVHPRADRLRQHGERIDAQPVVLERIPAVVDAQRRVVADAVADGHQPVGEPRPQAVLVEHGHDHVDVGLELPQAFRLVADRTIANALELDPEAVLEGLGQGDEVRHVHLHVVGVAVVAHHLVAKARDRPVLGGRPPALHGAAHHDHGPPVVGVPVLHGLERAQDLVVVVAVVEREHVPAVGRPLIGDSVAVQRVGDHAADQRVVDPGVVERQHDAQPLADALRHGLGLELLRVPGGHGELAFERHDLRRIARAHEVPEGRLARGGGDADPRGPAVDVVDQVGRLRVSGKRTDAALPGLCEEWIVRQAVVLEQRLQNARTAAKAEAVDGQHRDLRIDVEPRIAGGRMPARHGLAHDHPQCVERGYVVAAGEQQLVAEGMLRTPVVVAQAAVLGACQVQGDVVGRIGQRSAEVTGLLVVAKQRQGHGRQKAHVLEALAVVAGDIDLRLNGFAALAGGAN